MNDILETLLPLLREQALQQARYPRAYVAQCRRTDECFRSLWRSLNKKQRKLYLQYEAEYNARAASEEDILLLQVFRIARELYR